MINPSEVAVLLDLVETFHLELHIPGLESDLRALQSERPRATDARLHSSIQQRVQRFLAFHRDYPFVVAPGNSFSGQLILGYQFANKLPVAVRDEDLARHLGVFGGTGSGKTTFSHNLIRQVLEMGHKVFILDAKDDSEALAAHNPNFLVVSSGSKLNLIQKPEWLTADEFINVYSHVWGSVWYSGENQKQVLDEALAKAFRDHDTPSLADVYHIVEAMNSPRLTFQRRDAVTGVSNRLARFGRMFPVPFRTRRGIDYKELFIHPIYMNALFNDEHTTFIYTLLVYMLYLHNRLRGVRGGLDYLLVNDEGNRFWNVRQNNIGEAPTLVNLQGMIREFGIGLLHTSVDEASLHPILKSNTFTQVAMNVASGQEVNEAVRNLRLTPAQSAYMQKQLRRGQCIIRFADGWREPILACFPDGKQEKHLSASERHQAEERINRFAPPDLPPVLTNTRDTAVAAEPGPAPRSDPAQATLPSRGSPPAPAGEGTNRQPLKLNANEEWLLRACTESLLVATEAYERSQLARQAGQTAKDRLVQLGLLESASILVRPGRGGNALLLEPTQAAYELLGRQRPRGSRGGDSSQHRWLIRQLASRIPDVAVEFVVGGKSVDLLVRFQPAKHQLILFHIEAKLDPGDLVAIEVECTDPPTTASNNVTRNAAAGVAHTLVLVLPRQLEGTRRALAERLPALQGSFTVASAFDLLGESPREAQQ